MSPNEGDLAAVVEQLMNNKEARELIDKLKNSSSENDTASENNSASATDVPPPLDSQLVEQLPAVLSALSPLIETNNKVNSSHGGTAARNALLGALRPYLNDSRRALVERIMQLSRITDLVGLIPRDR